MDLSQFHFAHPLWLWAVLAIPLIGGLYFLFYQKNSSYDQLEKFIDKNLLPYLLLNHSKKGTSFWKSLLAWSLVFAGLVLAIAGPRWNWREMETFTKDQSLVVLLDLSQSMDAKDVKPSRIVRARQKIEDLINNSKGLKIGLIAFAKDPHMIAPLTDDTGTIRHLLPSLETDLMYVQGSTLTPAFEMASQLLDAEPGNNKAILLISDGGFEDASAITAAKRIAEKGVVIHAMGVGTVEGAPVEDHEGNLIKKGGSLVISKLEKEKLQEISNVGKGHYLEADFSGDDEGVILSELEKRAGSQLEIKQKTRYWEEHFYLLIFPLMPILLWWFRRGYIVMLISLLLIPSFDLRAFEADRYFKNPAQLGKEAMDTEDYDAAIGHFKDPYRKGVASYRAGNFAAAEKLFRQSSRPEVAKNAAYNLGNALVRQQKLKEAITAYEAVLKSWPDHQKAKDNLELVKKMLEQKEKENPPPNESDPENENNNSGEKGSEKGEHEPDPEEREQEGEPNESERDKGGNNDAEDDPSQEPEESDSHEQDPSAENDNNLQNQEADPQEEEGDETSMGEEEPNAKPQDNNPSRNDPQTGKSQEDLDADLWLNRLNNDPKDFLKKKCYIESMRNGTKEGTDPW